MRQVEFHPEAHAEFVAAAAYYESHAPNLGREFITVVEQSCKRLLDFPGSGRPFGERLRRTIVARFPYALLYRVEPHRIYVVAVMHLHRRPGYWRDRV